ncbi:MAG: TonB family protein [candidate division Zixibacteria bacterium]|nr:TonB family protein [candidate division Zixibacteria bacterium]
MISQILRMVVAATLLVLALGILITAVAQTDTARVWTEAELDTLDFGKWFWHDAKHAEIKAIEYTELDSTDRLPERSSYFKPSYPEKARWMLTSGDVILRVLVDHRGKLRYARILRDSGTRMGFEESALDLVRRCKWKPGEKDGKRVAVWMDYKVDFRLVRELDGEPIYQIGKWDYWVGTDSMGQFLERWPHLKNRKLLENEDSVAGPSDSLILPNKVRDVDPVYPRWAEHAGIEADIWVKALLDVDGKVKRASIMRPDDKEYAFNRSTLAAALEVKWTPAMKGGKPIPLYVSYKVSYRH